MFFLRAIFAAFLLVVVPAPIAHAQGTGETEASLSPAERLEALYARLRAERNEAAARRVAEQIRDAWASQGGETAELLIDWAQSAAREDKFHVALDLIDQVTLLYPGYANGFNARATIHLMRGEMGQAMADFYRVLSMEPRHFEAMAGVAGILRSQGLEEQALGIYRRMLEVYPMQRNAQRALIDITDDQTDERL
ncbi:hypothetical protein [Nitratireductor basaltis]|uniref:TPR repeat n=1 Tax=Nitratireductor basaltis TaxID=472175 RepID=A0A084U6R9_9HYPH|nr:hypothetical protein [Nitratireductor basaltis]KFB08655.1 TPR repeat precursor [Nitratireductor basaltis]